MISIDVYGTFDFTDNEIKIGVLSFERIKGSATYIFEYNPEFLNNYPNLNLSVDIGLFQGPQSVKGNIFSMFGDACPDRWGRALIDKREILQAEDRKTAPRKFVQFDYMVRLDDRTRMGALRFRHDGKLIGNDLAAPIPITADLETLILESQAYENALKRGNVPDKKWILNLCTSGSSLGGARPKANIIDNGELYIAKFPSIEDDYDIALWEQFASLLARKAGIIVPETKIVKLPSYSHHVFLSKRFDRDKDRRIHYASSLTLTGLKDGCGANTNNGYIDIVNAMISNNNVIDLHGNLTELFRRVVFNVAIGNSDDHFRNHGFLLTKRGWTLSPAFDMNPSNSLFQSLLITPTTNKASIDELLKASDYFFIDKADANAIVDEVKNAVSGWKAITRQLNIPKSEWMRFSKRFDMFCMPRTTIGRCF